MKLTRTQAESFINNPYPNIALILIFGPDNGLCKEHLYSLTKSLNIDMNDPFCSTILDSKDLESYSHKLLDEASSITFSGEKKLIIHKSNDNINYITLNKITQNVKIVIDNIHKINNVIILELGNIKSSSEIVKLVNNSKYAVSLSCFNESEHNIKQYIKSNLATLNVEMDFNALDLLSKNCGDDRKNTSNEIDKLISFVFPKNNVTVEDVESCLNNNKHIEVESITFSAIFNDYKSLISQANTLFLSGFQPLTLLKNTTNVLNIIHDASLHRDNGETVPHALDKVKPNIFWKHKQDYLKAINLFETTKIETIINKLLETEEIIKKHPEISSTIVLNTLLNLSKIKVNI